MAPKVVMNSVLYHKSLRMIKASPKANSILGNQIHMMTCNGKFWPLGWNCNYYMVLFGENEKAKVDVFATKNK